ncbi:MAG: bacillithiol biosynthesis deacetylase BshB1 [Planctomycetes bacterium]|nr:bacillithiol biosynthesis deacetylase BshB1 [Planctomycetota bacterium]
MSERMLPIAIAPCDVLAIAPHPDDAEIFCGGTLLRLREAGKRIGILDLTRGEAGSRGTADERDLEAAEASRRLDLAWRANLGLPDTAIEDIVPLRRLLAACIRRSKASILFGPDTSDYHPDHVAAAQLVAAAWFLAGVGGAPIKETPHRPRRYLRYLGNLPTDAQLLVDITPVWERKVEVVRAYVSQLDQPGRSGSHFLQGTDILGRMSARAVHFGLLGGVRYAEPFRADRPYLLDPIGLD